MHIALTCVKTVDLSLPLYVSGGIEGVMQPQTTNTPKIRPYDTESVMAMVPISNWQVLRPPSMLPY